MNKPIAMRTLFISVLFAFTVLPLLSQQEGTPSQKNTLAFYEDLFSAEEPLHLTLKMDVKALQKTKYEDIYHNADMILTGSENMQASHSVQVKSRESIRQKICYLPTLWLKMNDSGHNTDSGQDDLLMNLVMRCKSSASYESYVLREYLAYKIYNILTPLSCRVRLVKLSIVDTGRKDKVTEDWAFLREPDALMALRLKGEIIENDALSMKTVSPWT